LLSATNEKQKYRKNDDASGADNTSNDATYLDSHI